MGLPSTSANGTRSVPATLKVFAIFAISAVTFAAHAAEPPKLEAPDPLMPYHAQRSNPVTYDVDFSAVVTAPGKAKVLKVWLPLPQSNFVQEVTEGELSTFPMTVEPAIGTESKFGNKFAYFEFAAPQGRKSSGTSSRSKSGSCIGISIPTRSSRSSTGRNRSIAIGKGKPRRWSSTIDSTRC